MPISIAMDHSETLREVNPDPPPAPFDGAAKQAVAALARRQHGANSLLMRAITYAGGQVEDGMKLLPAESRAAVEEATRRALARSYAVAATSRQSVGARLASDRSHRVLATISGALGGLGGLPTALAELPVATTLIFRAVQSVAEDYGEDPLSEETRLECLAVFGSGGPGSADDGIDTSFLGARLSLSGAAVNALISRIAPKFAAVLSQKLATQAVPILGAAAGAGTNYAFTDYYVEIAHVHFGLRRLARLYGEEAVLTHFHAELARRKLPAHRRA